MAPSRQEITELFNNLSTGHYEPVFSRVSPDVDWTVMGTHPCAGRYSTLKDFYAATIARLSACMKAPIKMNVRNVIGGGEGDWATIELVAVAECKSGMMFDNTYAWCCRFNGSGMIVEVRAYLDSWMVKDAIETNEEGGRSIESRRAPVPTFE